MAKLSHTLNPFGQPVGHSLQDWTPPPLPGRELIAGRYCRLEPLDPDRHAEALYEAFMSGTDGRNWTYLMSEPFNSFEEFRAWLDAFCMGDDPLFFTIIRQSDQQPAGLASYLRIAPAAGSIEVGHLHFSEKLKRSPAATEAMFLMMERAFELGYRRYEWKCDALNAPSREAAQRLGFSYEGTFRQAMLYKGRTRDTAWFAMIDSEWPQLKQAFLEWLAPDNFDQQGMQRTRLRDLTCSVLQPGKRS
ncbi:MAG: GNAT family N-acetyltransferase [Endozoicomonas sp.]